MDPQIVHNRGIVEASHPVYGKYRRARPPLRFSKTEMEHRRAAPLFNEDAREILDELGVTDEEQAALRERGVLAPDAA